MNQKLLSGVLIFSLALNLAVIGTFAYHQFSRPDRPPPEFRKERQEHFFRSLNIPEPKRAKLFSLMEAFRDENQPLQERIFAHEKMLVEKIGDGKSNIDEINTVLDTLAALRLKQSKKAIDHFLKARTFLNARQQRKLFEMILRMRPPEGRGMKYQRRSMRRDN